MQARVQPSSPPAARRRSSDSAGLSRESLLLALLVLLVIFFGATAAVARLYHKDVHVLADEWFAKGEETFQSGHAAAALDDYRNALIYQPNNSVFQFHLAQALAAAGKSDEASSYLTNLLAESPGSGEVNLALARIAARKGVTPDALRYYHAAIYGVWEQQPLTMRWNVRLELCEYLLNRGDSNDAMPDLIALAQEVPPSDIRRKDEAAGLLLKAGLWNRALEEFRSVLMRDHHEEEALAGAGQAAFELGQYEEALDYFDRLPREKGPEADIAEMAETSRAVVSASPYAPGLSRADRAARTVDDLARAEARLEACAQQQGQSLAVQPPTTELQTLHATGREMSRAWSKMNLEMFAERIDAAMSLAFQMETASTQECGQPAAAADRALVLLAESRGAANP